MEDLLLSGLHSMGLTPPESAASNFRTYFELLEERNRVMNLTAISGETDVVQLHFLDCAALLCTDKDVFSPGASIVDVGSGAGFPGLVLKLLRPDLSLTLLDSQRKRVDFLQELCTELALKDVVCMHARAEEAAAELRGSFDAAVSRAVAQLGLLSELCIPFVRPGGRFLAMKGPDCEEELSAAGKAIRVLGGGTPEVRKYLIPGTDVTHSVVSVPKLTPTPKTYPRRWAKMQKQPL